MNLDKVFEFLRVVWAKHSPAIFTLIVCMLAINLYALPPGKSIQLGAAWEELKRSVDSTVAEMGVKVERGYVIVVLVYLAFVTISWVSSLLSSLPILRIFRVDHLTNVHLAERAGQLLGSDADLSETEKRLRTVLEKYKRSFTDRKERSPYAWLSERADLWHRYYGLAILAILALLACWLKADVLGVSPSRFLVLAMLATGFACVARLRYGTLHARQHEWEMGAALDAYERDRPKGKEPQEVEYARGRALGTAMKYARACDYHPTRVVMRVAHQFGRRAGQYFASRLNHVQYWESPDWRVFASAKMRFEDDPDVRFTALKSAPFAARFTALLECDGAGLFVLVESGTGLAPGAELSGERFCIAERSHAGRTLAIRYCDCGLSGSGSLSIETPSRSEAYIFDVGVNPIELLAQGRLPSIGGRSSWAMLSSGLAGGVSELETLIKESGRERGDRCRMSPGHSYLCVARASPTVNVAFALQSFAIDGRPGSVLIAFKILSVVGQPASPPVVLPWWRPAAWKGVWRSPVPKSQANL